ncbi:MAG TPA: hypothetical protein GX497_11830 [Bacillus bacterium]|nr:hypothetical protein [Bacillus sp. (in: firmicutes)]
MRWDFVYRRSLLCFILALLLLLPLGISTKAQSFDRNHYIYDFAGLLTDEEAANLQSLADERGQERDTAFIVITLDGTEGKDIVQYVEDFYDEHGPGFDQPYGNAAIIAIDMQERDIYAAGFKKAEVYLDDNRLDVIRNQITPALSDGEYFQAFSTFINSCYEYMGYELGEAPDENVDYTGPNYNTDSGGYSSYDAGVDPENIFFQWWFQVIASLVVASIMVGFMVYNSGGKVTVNARTYLNSNQSKVVSQYDNFVNRTVTKVKKPSNNTSGGGGGGGGITRGGHSHSGSRGKF